MPTESPSLKTYAIKPTDTDAAIAATSVPNLVAWDQSVKARGELFLLMGGSIVNPEDMSLFVRQGAANGFHVISLDFAREVKVPNVCEKSADEACYEKVRLEIIDGEDRTPAITVTRANSVMNRLTKLLTYLVATYPSDGWSAFLKDGAPVWSKIRLGGQSEGGTHAALIARDREVARVCLMEAPVDLMTSSTGERRLAPWIKPGATAADRYYGFRHLRSSSPLAPAFAFSFAALGLDRFGANVDADTSKPPYNNTHHLTTNLEPVKDGQANISHRSVIQDRVTPRTAEGKPVFAPVWQYMCFS